MYVCIYVYTYIMCVYIYIYNVCVVFPKKFVVVDPMTNIWMQVKIIIIASLVFWEIFGTVPANQLF